VIEALKTQSRSIVAHAWPILIAQLASMGMMVIDTVLLGHYGTVDLAAVAVGGGIYIAVVFALVGILQAVAPTVAHHVGAKREGEVAGALQQTVWLAFALACRPRCSTGPSIRSATRCASRGR
jgi:MATE family multidrug resistance protein